MGIDARLLADGIGIVGSALCAVHCLATPVLLLVATTLPASFLTNEDFHRTLLWLIIPAAILAFGLGCWRHKDSTVLFLGLLGLIGLSTSVAAHEILGETGERVVTVAAAAVLIFAHVRNFRQCRASHQDEEGTSC